MSIWWESVILRASVARSWPKSPPFASCYRCAELIDGRRWAKLTDRAFTNFIKQHGVPRYAQFDVREQFREIHQLFREHLVKES